MAVLWLWDKQPGRRCGGARKNEGKKKKGIIDLGASRAASRGSRKIWAEEEIKGLADFVGRKKTRCGGARALLLESLRVSLLAVGRWCKYVVIPPKAARGKLEF